jgi:hypothetical protein
MTPQELLRPRYRLYATYPGCPFKLGSVLIQKDLGATNNPYYEVGMFGLPNQPSLYNPENYPSNFCKLEWWQERSINDWPEYLRPIQGDVYRVEIQVDPFPRIVLLDVEDESISIGFVYLTPATLEQYISYKEKYYADKAEMAESFINQNDIK